MNKPFVLMMLWMMFCLPTLAQAPMDGACGRNPTTTATISVFTNMIITSVK